MLLLRDNWGMSRRLVKSGSTGWKSMETPKRRRICVRGLVVDDGIRMDGLIQRRELPWGDEQGRWLKNGVDC